MSFDNVKVGQLIGQGEVDCIAAWNVAKPNILIMDGDPTDNNATLFAQGYNGVLKPKFDDGTYVKVGEPAGTWTPAVAATTFEQQFTAHPNINAVVTPNDDNANAVIADLQKNNIPAKTFPTTGQDASLPGLQNILKGYQCGTVYKAVYLEAQAAVADRPLPAGRPEAAVVARQRHDPGHDLQHGHPVVAAHPGVGHHRQHGGDRRQGRRGQDLRSLRNRQPGGLHRRRHPLGLRH